MGDLSVTLVQTNLIWEDRKANLSMLEDKINSIKEKTHVVVLPEMFSTGFSMQPEKFGEEMNGESVAWMRRVANEKRVIVTGSIIIKENERFFNRLVWMLPNGQYGFYDKRHLFAYAGEDRHYTAGSERMIASVNGWKLNLQVCYDLRFPVWARQQCANGQPEYDVLVYVANWPQKRSTGWKALLQARAIENQCYVIGVNRVGNDGNEIAHSGDSCVIDPLGKMLTMASDEEALMTVVLQRSELDRIREQFQFLRDADAFEIAP